MILNIFFSTAEITGDEFLAISQLTDISSTKHTEEFEVKIDQQIESNNTTDDADAEMPCSKDKYIFLLKYSGFYLKSTHS